MRLIASDYLIAMRGHQGRQSRVQAEAAGAGREALKKLHATMFLQRRARGWLVQADGRSAVVQAAALLDVRATRASCGHHTAALGRLSSFVRIQRLTREGLDATRAWRAPAGSALRRMLAAVGGRWERVVVLRRGCCRDGRVRLLKLCCRGPHRAPVSHHPSHTRY